MEALKKCNTLQCNISLVIVWSTLSTLFLLSKIEGWSICKVIFVQSFPQAGLNKQEEVFMYLPRGFHIDGL